MAAKPKVTYKEFLAKRGPKARNSTTKNARAWERLYGPKDPKPGAKKKKKDVVPKVTAPPDPYAKYDRFKGMPGAVDEIRKFDTDKASHQKWAQDVATWFKSFADPLQAANTAANDQFQANVNQASQIASLPTGQLPTVTLGGQVVQPGAAGVALQAGEIQGKGLGAAMGLDAAFRSVTNKETFNNLQTGLGASLAQQMADIPGRYNMAQRQYVQKLDEALAAANAEAAKLAQEWEIEKYKASNQRYIAQIGYLKTVLGQEGQNARAQLDAETRVTLGNQASQDRAADRQQRSQDAAADRQVRLQIAQIQSRTQQLIQKSRAQVARLQKSGGKPGDVQKVIAEFQKIWVGNPGDPLKGKDEYGQPFGRSGLQYLARDRKANADGMTGRRYAAAQAVGWLSQFDFMTPQQTVNILRGRGFTQREIQQAIADAQNGF